MPKSTLFDQLVADGRPTGEAVAGDGMRTVLKGLSGVAINGVVLFENGVRGLVRSISDQHVEVLNLTTEQTPMGMLAVAQDDTLVTPVGEELMGRVVNVLGEPLDGLGPITTKARGAVFREAPGVIERKELSDQLVCGVTVVDALFPVVLGQRIAVLGDSKAGKSTFLSQLMQNQVKTDHIVIYVQIAKRQVDVDTLVGRLRSSGVLAQSIVVVASSFDSLTENYLAPYVACAMGEHLWEGGKNVIMIYDDLSSHAKVYREISLLGEVSPGRDSYPGDMFYAHSSLLERAGKLESNGATMTALPVVQTPNDDITAYLPTNIMSITDGQIIFDLTSFRKGIRPAVNVGLSVSRVGGRVQNKNWKQLTGQLFRKLADYRQAQEFAQFGSELAAQSQADLALGKALYEAFKQTPQELYGISAQYLILATIIQAAGRTSLDVAVLKREATAHAGVADQEALDALLPELLQKATIQKAAV